MEDSFPDEDVIEARPTVLSVAYEVPHVRLSHMRSVTYVFSSVSDFVRVTVLFSRPVTPVYSFHFTTPGRRCYSLGFFSGTGVTTYAFKPLCAVSPDAGFAQNNIHTSGAIQVTAHDHMRNVTVQHRYHSQLMLVAFNVETIRWSTALALDVNTSVSGSRKMLRSTINKDPPRLDSYPLGWTLLTETSFEIETKLVRAESACGPF